MTSNLQKLNQNLERITEKSSQLQTFGDMWKTLRTYDIDHVDKK